MRVTTLPCARIAAWISENVDSARKEHLSQRCCSGAALFTAAAQGCASEAAHMGAQAEISGSMAGVVSSRTDAHDVGRTIQGVASSCTQHAEATAGSSELAP